MARTVLRVRSGEGDGYEYRLRPFSFISSTLLHLGVATVAMLVPVRVPRSEVSKRPIYDTYIRAEERRIVWYRFPKDLPSVRGARVPYAPQPQALKRSSETVIAISDAVTKSEQLIWRPGRPPSISTEVRSPNLIALAPAQQLPPPPKKVQFTPPPTRAPAPSEPKRVELDAPSVDVRGAAASVPALDRRQFVAPPPKTRTREADASIQAPELTVAAGPDEGGLNAVRQMRAAAPVPPSRLSVPASGSSGTGQSRPERGGASGQGGKTGPAGEGGTSSATMAIVGLNPSDRLGEIPDGSRPGQFSTAPAPGSPGAPNGAGGIHVPGLRIDGPPTTAGASTATSPNVPRTAAPPLFLYSQTLAGFAPATFSAPLHPASRSIPPPVESRFHDRTVYVVVTPAPALPEYAGDWTIWFAERGAGPGGSRIRAPLPYRKTRIPEPGARSDGAGKRVLVPVLIAKNGTVQPLDENPATRQALEDLRMWEFQPAMRNGAPVDVEALLDLVFRDR